MFLSILLASFAAPQGEVQVSSVALEPTSVSSGALAHVQVSLDVAYGYHVYHPDQDPLLGYPVTVTVSGEGVAAEGSLVSLQAGILHELPVGEDVYRYLWLEGTPSFTLPVRVTGEAGARTLKVAVSWQTCDDSLCFPQTGESFSLDFEVTGDAVIPEGVGISTVDEAGSIQSDVQKKLDEGFWAFILAAILAGFATLATPCVFPMIPITVSFFTKRAESGKGSALGNATAYGIGIVLTFVGLGLGTAALLGAGGANDMASNPFLNIGLATLFVVFALSLLGFFEINPPRFLQNYASKKQAEGTQKAGYFPVVLMAVAFSITAFTCTVGFVGGLLGLAAGSGDMGLYVLSGMFVYAFVFATPFFFLALFPSVLQRLPSAGGWMNAVKVSLGYLELIAAWKFLSNADRYWDLEILTRPVVIVLTAAPLLLLAFYLFGWYRTKHDYEKPVPGKMRKLTGVGFLTLGIYIGMGLQGGPFSGALEAYFPPEGYGHGIGPANLEWHENYDEAFAEAKQEGKLLFLDFTGVTCVNCLRMEGNIMPHDLVKPLLEQMVRAELYVDKPPYGDWNSDFQIERFNTAQQPLYVVIDPSLGDPSKGGMEAIQSTFPGYHPDPVRFAAFLKDGMGLTDTE